MKAYAQSKIGNIFISQFRAEELRSSDISSLAVHPGAIVSDALRDFPRVIRFLAHKLLSSPTPKGAITQLYAGTSPEITLAQSGAYFVPWARIDTTARAELKDEEIKGKVIGLIKKQVAAKLG